MIEIKIHGNNPGEVFACYGLFELTGLLDENITGVFQEEEENFLFRLNTQYGLGDCIRHLQTAHLIKLKEEEYLGGRWVNFKKENKKEKFKWDSWAPVCLSLGAKRIVLNWWRTPTFGEESGLKFWGGRVKAHDHLNKMLEKLRNLSVDELEQRPFEIRIKAGTSFGFDTTIAWTPLDVGWSLNETKVGVSVSPILEILSAIGLQGFRPREENREIRYFLWGEELPLCVARIACSGGIKMKGIEWRAEWEGRGTRDAYKSLVHVSRGKTQVF